MILELLMNFFFDKKNSSLRLLILLLLLCFVFWVTIPFSDAFQGQTISVCIPSSSPLDLRDELETEFLVPQQLPAFYLVNI